MFTLKKINILLIVSLICLWLSACPKEIAQTPIRQQPASGSKVEHGIIYDKTIDVASIKLENGRKLQYAFNLPFTIGDRVNLSYVDNRLTEIEIIDLGIVQVQGDRKTSEAAIFVNEKGVALQKSSGDESLKNNKEAAPRKTVLCKPATDIGRSWAVIIGISKYEYADIGGLTNLNYADNDARDFALMLENLGWSRSHIKLLINEEATQRNIIIALESWLTKSCPNDQIVLYWSGHGFPDPEDREKVYFACYDTNITIPASGYRMDRVRSTLEERKSRNVVIIADTCHAGKLITRGIQNISIAPQLNKMRKEKTVPKGWIFMVSADADREAIEFSSWSNGAFTHLLLKGLKGEADGFEHSGAKDEIVTMGELRVYLSLVMPDLTQEVLGVAKRPLITTGTGDPNIWNMTFQAVGK